MPNLIPQFETLLLNGNDYTDAVRSLEFGFESVDQGLAIRTGSINLRSDTQDLDVWTNHDLCIGSRVNLAVAGQTYTLLITEQPQARPLPGQTVTIQIGCELAYRQGFQLDKDVSQGIRAGLTVGELVRRSLTAAGITNQAIGMNNVTIDWPIEKNGGSFIGYAGELAYSLQRVLYCNHNNQVRDRAAWLTTPVSVNVRLGSDDVSYTPGGETFLPPAIICASGITKVKHTRPNPEIDIKRVRDRFGNLLRTITTTTTYSARRKTVRVVTANTLFTESVGETIEHYNFNLRLDKITRTLERPRGILEAELDGSAPTNFNLVPALNEIEQYSYSAKDQIDTILISTEKPSFVNGRYAGLVQHSKQNQTWQYKGNNYWEQVTASSIFIGTREYQNGSTERETNDGSTMPPATRYMDNLDYWEDEELSADVRFGSLCPADTRLSTYPLELSLAINRQQLINVAVNEGRFFWGRYLAYNIELDIDQVIALDFPLFRIDVTELDGRTFAYLADQLTMSMEITSGIYGEVGRSSAVCKGILVGQVDANGNIIPPYRQSQIDVIPIMIGVLS